MASTKTKLCPAGSIDDDSCHINIQLISSQVYYEPLKRPQAAALVEPSLVEDIFYQIPEICSLHEHFLHQLNERVEHWDTQRKIGDIFVNTVRSDVSL